MEALKSLLQNMDLGALLGNLLPDLSTVMGRVEMAIRLAVMAGPLIMLGLGLLFLLAPPKEANYGLGYRSWWGMASLEAWKYTQRLAGMIWSSLGAVLTIVFAFLCNGLRGMNGMDMVIRGAKCIFWELIFVAAACIAIDVMVMKAFDRDGFRREPGQKNKKER